VAADDRIACSEEIKVHGHCILKFLHTAKHGTHKYEVDHFDVNITQFGPITELDLIIEREKLPYTATSQVSGQSKNPQLKDRICDNVLPGKGYDRPPMLDMCGVVSEIMISTGNAKRLGENPATILFRPPRIS
jgi:hypothetical protein